MIRVGQIVVFSFPQTDQVGGKLRPALVLAGVPGSHNDWLVCMISSQLRQELPGIDEVMRGTDPDFQETGLKLTSLIRITRLAVVNGDLFRGALGTLAERRLLRIRQALADWILGAPATNENAGHQI